MTTIERINSAVGYLREKAAGRLPEIGIVLGSGLGGLADKVEDALVIPYGEIPEFPVSTAIGHKGNLIFGKLGGKNVVAMQGRFHFYEGYDMATSTIGIRVMAKLGVNTLFVSNAAGGCNPGFNVGDLMIIRDHINLLPNPLIGPNMDEFGPRFPDMTCPYDLGLVSLAEKVAANNGIVLHRGVYLASTGPTYETPAEVRFYQTVGADALGMSTTPEVIVARHCGMRVFGMSVITNVANKDNIEKNFNDENDVIVQASIAADKMCRLFIEMIKAL